MNCAKFSPPVWGAYDVWKRGDEHPLNSVTDTTLLSFLNTEAILSATADVRWSDVPVGM